MCTVTYIPRPNKSFVLTSNRDEAPDRAAIEIATLKIEDRKVYFPKDVMAGGTWMAMDNEARAVCLLNGADEKHDRLQRYRRSRGLMVLDYFSFSDHVKFIAEYNFEGIEPFTMILVQPFDLTVLKWNGKEKNVAVLDPHKQHIWSSVMLYDKVQIEKREAWFNAWKAEENFSVESINKFHKTSGNEKEEGMLIDRATGVKTLSLTSIQKKDSYSFLEHHDLVEEKIKRIVIEYKGGTDERPLA